MERTGDVRCPRRGAAVKRSDIIVHLDVVFFGSLTDHVPQEIRGIAVPDGTTVAGLAALLTDVHPALSGRLDHVAVAVNRAYATTSTVLCSGDEVAFLPPVSGG